MMTLQELMNDRLKRSEDAGYFLGQYERWVYLEQLIEIGEMDAAILLATNSERLSRLDWHSADSGSSFYLKEQYKKWITVGRRLKSNDMEAVKNIAREKGDQFHDELMMALPSVDDLDNETV